MKFALILGFAITSVTMVTPVLAHTDYDRHARDHVRHRQLHYRDGRAHEWAHEKGFSSRAEHRGYHRALQDRHRDFHYHHPGTRHDHQRWWR